MAHHKTARFAKDLTRGELAVHTGSNVETIRYYEKIGLLPEPPRNMNAYRLYDEALVRRLRFILRARELGFNIVEIRGLLQLVEGDHYTCAEVNDIAVRHLDDIRLKIADLKKLATVLGTMSAQCSKGQVPECPIIDALSVDA